MADSIKGYGSSVSTSDTENGTYTPISQCRDITPPKFTVDSDDTKHQSSPNQFKEKDPGWHDADPVAFDMLFTKAQYTTLVGIKGVQKWWKVTDSQGNVEKFYGFVSSLGRELPLEGRVTATVEITIATMPTYTAAS